MANIRQKLALLPIQSNENRIKSILVKTYEDSLMNLDRVSSGANIPDEINVIIEIPAHSDPVKYEVDKETGAMFVDPKFIGTGKGRDLSRPVYRYRSGRDKSCPYDEIAIYTSTFKIHSLGNGLTKVGTFVDLPLESFD